MKRTFLGFGGFAVSAVLIAAPLSIANAADMAVKAPPPAPPVAAPGWNGFYVGGNAGYAWGKDPVNTTGHSVLGAFPLSTGGGNVSPNGGFGGLQAGYNWQATPDWVVGLETDFQFSGLKDTQNCLIQCGIALPPVGVTYSRFAMTDKMDWWGTVRGRVGYLVGSTLAYVTGGLAYGEIKRSATVTGVGPFGAFAGGYGVNSTDTGWTVGAGLESKLWSPGWTAKIEYLYLVLGGNYSNTLNEIYASGAPGGVRTVTGGPLSANIVRAGLNYHFN